MYKHFNKQLPPIFNNMFIKACDVHPYPTRTSTKLVIPASRTSLAQTTIRHKGVILWNCITDNILYDCSFGVYKRTLKSALIDNRINIA